jgi:hypothetical protein
MGHGLAEPGYEAVGSVGGKTGHEFVVGRFEFREQLARRVEIEPKALIERRVKVVSFIKCFGEGLFERFLFVQNPVPANEPSLNNARAAARYGQTWLFSAVPNLEPRHLPALCEAGLPSSSARVRLEEGHGLPQGLPTNPVW